MRKAGQVAWPFRFQIAMKPQKQAFLAQLSPTFLSTFDATTEARGFLAAI
jgi:hypothetical protein